MTMQYMAKKKSRDDNAHPCFSYLELVCLVIVILHITLKSSSCALMTSKSSMVGHISLKRSTNLLNVQLKATLKSTKLGYKEDHHSIDCAIKIYILCFSYYICISPLETGISLHLKRIESLSPKYAF
jgi:hypothetical protein